MTSKTKIRIVKVPLQTKTYDRPQTFPRFPVTLYLELLENKEKVQKELVNTPYKSTSPVDDTRNLESRLNDLLEGPGKSPSPNRDRNDKEDHTDDKDDKSSVQSDSMAKRLNELLDDDNSVISVTSPIRRSYDKYSRSVRKEGSVRGIDPFSTGKQPRTLEELEATGGYNRGGDMPNVGNVGAAEQQEEDLKRELLYKIRLLKKKYPNGNIGNIEDFTVHSDLEHMRKEYDSTVRNLTLDSNVENWKTWLMYGFVGTEYVLGKFLNLDMEGFASQQMVNMNKYDKLLIEIGEKNYVKGPSKLPVEVRLVLMIITQAAFFLVTKMLMKKTGADLLGMFNSAATSSNQPHGQNPEKRRKMRGPSVDFDDLP